MDGLFSRIKHFHVGLAALTLAFLGIAWPCSDSAAQGSEIPLLITTDRLERLIQDSDLLEDSNLTILDVQPRSNYRRRQERDEGSDWRRPRGPQELLHGGHPRLQL